jgi:uncharacterized integral membrane protein
MTDTSANRRAQPHPIPADTAPPTEPPAAETAPPSTAPTPSTVPTAPAARNPLRRTRTSAVWAGVIVFAVVLVLLLIFILQNTQSVQISYFAATGHVSLAVAMLLAAVAGVLLTATAGSLRIWQLRRRLPRSTRR